MSEHLAVGRTEDGTVVFYDLDTQPRIRQVLPRRPITGGGKSMPIVVVDELAMLLPNPEIGELVQQLLAQARRERES